MMVCHKCDTPACINPDHLFIGTAADNSADMSKKGRLLGRSGEPRNKLTDEQVAYIRANAGKVPQREIMRMFGITARHITALNSGECRKA
jgi:hypothetical protein